jgi:hypothetical protein
MSKLYTMTAAAAVAICLALGWGGAAAAAPMTALPALKGELPAQATSAHYRRYYHCHRRCWRHRGHYHCRRYCHRGRRW